MTLATTKISECYDYVFKLRILLEFNIKWLQFMQPPRSLKAMIIFQLDLSVPNVYDLSYQFMSHVKAPSVKMFLPSNTADKLLFLIKLFIIIRIPTCGKNIHVIVHSAWQTFPAMRRSKCDDLFLKCLFYVLKFLGVAPMAIDNSPAPEKDSPRYVRFVASKLGVFYNGIIACLTVYPSYMTVRYLTSSEYTKNIELEKVIDEAQSTFAMITSTFIIVNICVRQKRAAILANQLSSIHSVIMDLAIDVGDDVRRNTIISYIKKIVFVNLVTTIVWVASTPPEEYQYLSYFIVMSFYNIIIHAMLLQYSLVLKLLQQLYRSVNADLSSLLKKSSSISDDNNCHLMLKRLKHLRQIHATLCQISQDVSNFYSLPMLFCVTHVFLTQIIYCYYVVMTLIVWNINEKPILVILNCVTLVTLLAVSMTILVRDAGVTAVESKSTGEIVSGSIDDCQDHEIERQLNVFSNYLLHKDVHFSVFNLFPLNESLLISIVGSITTYLVILLEFEVDSTKK
ncbi:gustatory receptor 18 isoform X1 [Nasonia vitripennis]|uniref:Gustatory receptor n=2 Tax=Nasonia vitripennis TaxID=7425 RepID=A0A7M7QID8_NASVI|nr:gustatory receptor 18 isoform X1 [Nasonia vitripennis]